MSKKFFACALGVLAAWPLFAQRVYSELSDENQLRVFTEVSEGLICQCGCHMVLSTCPHVECPWGIPARRFIENRIRAGKSAATILDGFENGFGDEVFNDPVVRALQEQGRTDFVEKLRFGYGPGIRARTGHLVPALFVIAFSLAMFWLGHHWLRRNRAARTTNRTGAGDAEVAPALSGPTEGSGLAGEVERRVEDLDR